MLVGLSPLSDLKSCMSNFVALGSRWISLTERSRSSFSLVVSLLCAGEDLSTSGNADEDCQW
jgi:hypothetical protein